MHQNENNHQFEGQFFIFLQGFILELLGDFSQLGEWDVLKGVTFSVGRWCFSV
jgi:hypothetical protein